MNLLLDTQSLLWAATNPELLSPGATRALSDPANRLMLSAVVPWELAIKWELGRLREYFDDPEGFVLQQIREFNLVELPITSRHALATARLPRIHKDPFDRVLIAQAQVERLPLITADRTIGRYPVETLW